MAPTRYGVVTERGLAPLGAAAHPAAPREPKSRPCQSAALRAGEASGLLTQQGGDATAGTNASTRFLGLPYSCLQEETPPRAFVASQRFRAAPRSRRWSTVTAGGASGSVLPRVFFFWLQFSRPWVRGRLGWVCEKLWSSIRTAAVPQVGRAGLCRRAPQLKGRPEKPLGKPS